MMSNRSAVIIILDGLGAGDAPDCFDYGDENYNTLAHSTDNFKLSLPNFKKFGLCNLINIPKCQSAASFGLLTPRSKGKSTIEGHWEMMGVTTVKPFPTYPNGFPLDVIEKLQEKTGRKYLWNKPASGTEIINQLGDEHMKTAMPILYTSADSVMQISAHEDIISVPELFEICKVARAIMTGKDSVSRVIARPFLGKNGSYYRTSRRRDFCLEIPKPNVLSKLKEAGIAISGVGRITDLFNEYLDFYDYCTGITDCIEKTRMYRQRNKGLVFANCEELDMLYGHRRDKEGFAQGLMILDKIWPKLTNSLGNNDLLIVASDHGNDPTCKIHTDHTREYSIFLAYMKGHKGVDLGVRSSLSDVGATILGFFGLPEEFGESILTKANLL
jgi:phosphopentomutase